MKKMIKTIIIPLIFFSIKIDGLSVEKANYYLYIPGIKGDVEQMDFKDWIHCSAFQYLIPGLPSASSILKIPPEKPFGMMTAKEIDKPYSSFSKNLGKIDQSLYKIFNQKKKFPQWELAICDSQQTKFMSFVFKDIRISSITPRENKLYVTFKYEKVIWNYLGKKK